jgi:hypothetical protein
MFEKTCDSLAILVFGVTLCLAVPKLSQFVATARQKQSTAHSEVYSALPDSLRLHGLTIVSQNTQSQELLWSRPLHLQELSSLRFSLRF